MASISDRLFSLIETLTEVVHVMDSGHIFSAKEQLKCAVLADNIIEGGYPPNGFKFLVEYFLKEYGECQHKDPIIDDAKHHILAKIGKGEWNDRLPKIAILAA